jgi:hypothetical protein
MLTYRDLDEMQIEVEEMFSELLEEFTAMMEGERDYAQGLEPDEIDQDTDEDGAEGRQLGQPGEKDRAESFLAGQGQPQYL